MGDKAYDTDAIYPSPSSSRYLPEHIYPGDKDIDDKDRRWQNRPQSQFKPFL